VVERWPAKEGAVRKGEGRRRRALQPLQNGEGGPARPGTADTSASTAGSSSAGGASTAPKLLRDLEFFLETELAAQGLTDPPGADHAGGEGGGGEARLQVFREALDCYIEHCATYRPLLSRVKAEYDRTVRGARAREREGSPRPCERTGRPRTCERTGRLPRGGSSCSDGLARSAHRWSAMPLALAGVCSELLAGRPGGARATILRTACTTWCHS
jgi:hypothetical protein